MVHQQSRRQYDKQFKIDAVELTLKGDKTAKEIADALGINRTCAVPLEAQVHGIKGKSLAPRYFKWVSQN